MVFSGVPHLTTFIFILFNVKASFAYIHPVYSAILTHNILVVSLLP
jgi:hypothetical protein